MTAAVQLQLPDADWLEIPVGIDITAWAHEAAAELADGRHELVEPLVAELSLLAGNAAAAEVIAAAALLAGPDLPYVVASLQLTEVICGDTVEAVSAELSEESPHDLVPATVETVRLPAGDAVRLRTLTGEESGPVVESVDYVLPRGAGLGVRLQLSWLSIAIGDELGSLADECARGLSLTEDGD